MAILLGLAGSAWLISARLATPDMRLGVLTGASMMSASSRMGMPGSTSMGLSVFIATWTIMMVAMMVPSVVPAVRTFDTWARTTGQSGGATVLCVTMHRPGLNDLSPVTIDDWRRFWEGALNKLRIAAEAEESKAQAEHGAERFGSTDGAHPPVSDRR